ncbi:ATP/GTP-binding protein [Corynebacterium sp. HMSC29G08]|uniref:AAA family ATPase n=1 Tax=Corynebacterium sp. HMSC29G08 TaxID=1581069 RepID=UPI0008A2952E|nr:AAA family ATPase [Corynebacterium sp. HMSC29G08]OFT84718.1 hypothetical protein HMPREF3101_03945 [Corynebacterium sp. HMSC29G08]
MSVNLLSFSVGNFKSVREIQTLEFADGPLDSKQPRPVPVSVLLGANASGKSNLLEAMVFALRAMKLSATAWLDEDHYEYDSTIPTPFSLDQDSPGKPSFFEFDFVAKGRRYLYGFTFGRSGVVEEWMSYVPSVRWTPVFNRTAQPEVEWEWNSSAVSRTLQREIERACVRELGVSHALRGKLGLIYESVSALLDGVNYLPLGDSQKDQRLSQLARAMRKGQLKLSEVTRMMQAADTGIVDVSIDEENLSPSLAELAKILTQRLEDVSKNEKGSLKGFHMAHEPGAYIDVSDAELKAIAYQLMFTHRGDNSNHTLKMAAQSDGTLTWLSVAPIIVDALRNGHVVIADELDSSLHVQLLELVVKAFTDETINVNGAQLIFSSHDTNLLEHMSALGLDTNAFWFVEKLQSGASEVFPLSGFEKRKDANYERRYLDGRYGALPRVSPALIRGLVLEAVGAEPEVADGS